MTETDEGTDHTLEKICLVCGDKALSCNFGAITCESCKAFFRRNASKEWGSKCDGNCSITIETRSYCKKCRLMKCLQVGMNKSLILSDEQKQLRRKKILENKLKRGGMSHDGSEHSTMDSMSPKEYSAHSDYALSPSYSDQYIPSAIMSPNQYTPTQVFPGVPLKADFAQSNTECYNKEKLYQSTSFVLSAMDTAMESSEHAYPEKRQRIIQGPLEQPTYSENFPSTGIAATKLKYLMDSDSFQRELLDLPEPVTQPNYGLDFEGLEHECTEFAKHIDQLRYASSMAFNNAKRHNKCPSDPNYVQIFNFSEPSIKCLVTLAKNLEPFLNLSTDDQIVLLKNSILEMMVLGSAPSYDYKKKGWVVVDGEEIRTVETTNVKLTNEGRTLMNHYEMIILYVLSASRRDLGVIVLLTVLSLFSTFTANVRLENKDLVEFGYKIYLNVLEKYTQLKYPEQNNMMENLLRALTVVRDFSETYMQSILKSPLNKINPLLLEIFDLPMPNK